MGFVAVCTAIYDYAPQSANELEFAEGELLYILEKSTEDDWWKGKKKAADEEEDEPMGLIPNNYVEPAVPTHSAKALYDYSKQTDEEVSFAEDASIEVFDTSDPDWTLIGVNGEYGFAPANYIELSETAAPISPRSPALPARQAARPVPQAPVEEEEPEETHAAPSYAAAGPAASLAAVLGGGTPKSPINARSLPEPPRQQFTPEASDEEDAPPPRLPARPPSQSLSPPPTQYASVGDDEPSGVLPSPPYNRAVSRTIEGDVPQRSPGGYHLYNINEMVSAMGKRKKMPTTLGINIATGTIMLSPEKSRDGPSQEWTADKMTHYSIEGKHVFIELIRPSKSLDLHAGAKDTAQEIVSSLGEIAGAVRGEGLREVIAAASSGGIHKKGQVLYDFMAQGDDEVTVGVGDEVIVVDDVASEEWWKVRRLKNGKEGVVPSSYIEITGTSSIEPSSRSGVNAGRTTVDQNRAEEERMFREAQKAERREKEKNGSRQLEIQGVVPDRQSSLTLEDTKKKDKKSKSSKSDKPKPDPKKIRTWTDRTGSFKVEAQFIGLTDGKIHLHKVNGIKIAVPVAKMAVEDLEYVERVAGVDLSDDKPLLDPRRKSKGNVASKQPTSGASVERQKVPEYDWFNFFLESGVGVHQCERYAQMMNKDQMDESIQSEITPEVLRSLGLKEGDILRVMRHLDNKFNRTRGSIAEGANGTGESLFSGPGGALKNNTARGRPAPNQAASDTVDAKAFDAGERTAETRATPLASAPAPAKLQQSFDDDAWEVKPSRQAPPAASSPAPQPVPPKPAPPQLTAGLADMSLLSPPLEPTKATPSEPPAPVLFQPQSTVSPAPPQQPQQTGANRAFFSQLGPQQTGYQRSQDQQFSGARQRPQPPQQSYTASALLPPPPRPMSAPQNVQQQNQFGAQRLQPQLTGYNPPSQPQIAAPGQSLGELNQQRMQQQQFALQPQPIGFPQQAAGLNPTGYGMMPQQTGYVPSPLSGFQNQQPYLNGNQAGSPFADPRPSFQPQQTGFGQFQQQGPPPSGINSILPPALQPQPTGFPQHDQQQQQALMQQNSFQPLQPQPTGFPQQPLPPQPTGFPQPNGFGQQSFQAPPMPPMPPQHMAAPLVAQKTGPAPPIRFGVEAKKLTPQPTGRRANLSQASKLICLTCVPYRAILLTIRSCTKSLRLLSPIYHHIFASHVV